MKKVILATDHAGFEHKEHIRRFFASAGIIPVDDVRCTFFSLLSMTILIICIRQLSEFSGKQEVFGIFFGGSGQGEAMVANRYPGVRALVYTSPDLDLISLGRGHNDANVLAIGARFVTERQAEQAVKLFLTTPFPGEDRHVRRLGKLERS